MTASTDTADHACSTREAVAGHPLWYHTMELAPGLLTPGWFDLRPVVDLLPWPDVRGKRCLDVGPWDGFLSFELERRGAAEVVAADIGHQRDWDWPVRTRERGPEVLAALAGGETGGGFEIARKALGSEVERLEVSVYDLSPESVGEFDVVVCGSLLLHLRDPVRALEAIRGVCSGSFLSTETIRLALTLRHPRRAVADFSAGENCQWWLPNLAAYRELVRSAGFELEQASRPFSIPLGPGHPDRAPTSRRIAMRRALARRAPTLVPSPGSVHQAAILARPLPVAASSSG